MHWITRHAVLALCLSLGTSTWYIFAQKGTSQATPAEQTEGQLIIQANDPANQPADGPVEEPSAGIPGQTIKFGPLAPVAGYVNAHTIHLRDRPENDAPVVTKLPVEAYASVEILGATSDFLHVRFKAGDGAEHREHDYEGWAKWGSVVPNMSAIVLDAETGAVVSRIPLSESFNSVIYSPDGERAIFSNQSDGMGQTAYEVQTSDYTLTRSLTATDKEYFGRLFYGPADGALYATVHIFEEPYPNKPQVSLIRIGEDGAANVATGLNINDGGMAISPDGLTGFISRSEEGNNGLTVDVIELATQTVRNTFTLTGPNVRSSVSNFVLSRDGLELYEQLSETTSTISVIDTRTGQIVRELPGPSTQGWPYFSQNDLVGDSLLLRTWESVGDEEARQRLFWVSKFGSVEAGGEIAYAVEANGRRYAVNANGTQLFKLNDDNSILQKLPIARPERRKGALIGNELTVFSLSASPDGKRLILLVGLEHGC